MNEFRVFIPNRPACNGKGTSGKQKDYNQTNEVVDEGIARLRLPQ